LTVAGSGNNLLVGDPGLGSGFAGLSVNGNLNSTDYSLAGSATDGLFLNSPAGQGMRFQVGGVDKMIMTSAGNLGIGTDSPSQKLTVAGTASADAGIFGGTNVIDNNGITLNAGSGINLVVGDVIVQSGEVTVTAGDITAVGGTITASTLRGASVIVDNGVGAAQLSFANAGGNASFTQSTANSMDIVINGLPAMTIESGGDLRFYNDLTVLGMMGASQGLTANGLVYFNGKVGIGAATNGVDQLYIVGNTLLQDLAADNVTAAAYYHSSDRELKDHITPLAGSLAKVLRLQGVTYAFKTEPDRMRVGLIAQDVEAVVPEVVTEMKDGHKGVAYSDLVAVLIEAVRDQQSQIDVLRNDIQALQPKI
jgi:hypothetical protein